MTESTIHPFSITIAILAKAPVAGLAKTRLIPRLGADGAAQLQARMIERSVRTAVNAQLGPVVLWCSPDTQHSQFQRMAADFPISLQCQPAGDLGMRMLSAVAHAAMATLVIGTDCPALTPAHLCSAAKCLADGNEAVFYPAEDGGYVLVGLRQPQPRVFADVLWSSEQVMAQTRQRLLELGLRWSELELLWDVDRPEDIDLLAEAYPELLARKLVP